MGWVDYFLSKNCLLKTINLALQTYMYYDPSWFKNLRREEGLSNNQILAADGSLQDCNYDLVIHWLWLLR